MGTELEQPPWLGKLGNALGKDEFTTMEYVASGTNYTYAGQSAVNIDAVYQSVLDVIQTKAKHNSHGVSFLFNALTEKRLGEVYNTRLRDNLYGMHSDSGGLQMITLGQEITTESKNQIYECQGKYSDIAMSFDVIPVRTATSGIGKADFASRVFDPTMMDQAIKESANNIIDQVEYFDKMGTTAKPLLIIQGNDVDTYKEWNDKCWEIIPDDYHSKIGGVSLSSASAGPGVVLDGMRGWLAYNMDIPASVDPRVHLLGVGAVNRLLSFLIMDWQHKSLQISYDSTSHACSIATGSYYNDFKFINIPKLRLFDEVYKVMTNDINTTFGTSYDVETIADISTTGASRYNGGTQKEEFYAVQFMLILVQTLKFTKDVQKVRTALQNGTHLSRILPSKTKGISDFENLKTVRDRQDFDMWFTHTKSRHNMKGVVQSLKNSKPSYVGIFNNG